MNKFTAPLTITDLGDGKNFRVEFGFSWLYGPPSHDMLGPFVIIPDGFVTDLASIPFGMKRLFRGNQAAVVHDLGYRQNPGNETRKFWDLQFYYGMLCLGVPKWKAMTFYQTLRATGWVVWNKHRSRPRLS